MIVNGTGGVTCSSGMGHCRGLSGVSLRDAFPHVRK